MTPQMYLNIKRALGLFKKELENNIPFVKSEIVELSKPSMMGKSGLYYHLETDNSGVAIFFWDSGIFEISSDIIVLESDDNVFFNYVPHNYQDKNYPEESMQLFLKKINEFLTLLKKDYPNIKSIIG